MSLKRSRNTSVPILLNEFPVPPTFIPQNLQALNPPPSRPPSLPLPPIPGPSPLSENDLIHITVAARSRRTSRLSTSSNSSSWRGSVASIASASSGPSSHAAPTSTSQLPSRNRTESAASTSTPSARSKTSLPVPLSSCATPRAANPENHRPPPTAILEDDESLSGDSVEPSLTLTSLSEIPRASPSPYPHVGDELTIRGERLSSIDMGDLPPLQDDDTTDLDSKVHLLNARASRPMSPVHKSRIRPALPRPQPQPKTDGKAHRHSSSTMQHARNREFQHDASDTRVPSQGTSVPDGSGRASSPDVASFLATTPRPRRRSETSTSSRSQSQSRRRTHKSLPSSSRASAVGRLSVFSLPDQPTRQGSASLTSQSLLAYAGNADDGYEMWNDDSLLEDYGVAIGNADGDFANGLDEDDATGDSDSSLDLHTPLPNLMLRDGLLSPHSKLLPQNIVPDSPMVATDGNRHGSVISAKTKSGVFKDERDTIRRRVRHRDGRLLRGGIGLTTGLGWSDSEDEDAPSPLTKRLSHLALSRQSSAASLKSVSRASHSHPHPLSRSFSGDAKVYSSKSTQNLKRPSLPPTSWQSRSRTVASALSLTIAEQDPLDPASTLARFSDPSSSHVEVDSQRNDQVRTPSSSSTQSLPGPVTPDVTDVPASVNSWDREKSLPPIPISRVPSLASLRPVGSLSDMKNRPPRLETLPQRRPISSESDLSDPPVVSPHTPKLSNPHTSTFSPTRTTPRRLQLSASLGTGLQPGEPASMQGLLLGYNRQLHEQQRARSSSGPSSPSAPTGRYSARPPSSVAAQRMSRSGSVDLTLSDLGEPRLRPRTGTGMVYKKSSMSLTRAAAEVQAQSRIRMATERTSQVAS